WLGHRRDRARASFRSGVGLVPGGGVAGSRLLFERRGSGMACSQPWREQQQEPGVGPRVYGVAFVRIEFDEQAAAAADALASSGCDLDLGVQDEQFERDVFAEGGLVADHA